MQRDLCPELDRLRNKELSFGCVYTNIALDTFSEYARYTDGLHPWDEEEKTIIGHPLTRGRINHLHITREFEGDIPHGFDDARGRIMVLLSKNQLFDQNEIQRIQHEKRPELKALLVKFAEYL